MNGAFYIGGTGLGAQQRALDVVANNIANLNTPGFKRTEVRFSEMMSLGGAGERANGAADPGLLGVSVATTSRVFSQGDLKTTGRATDIAISGDGFVEVIGPSGQIRLWRGGALKVNPDGFLASGNGMA